jgi:transposase
MELMKALEEMNLTAADWRETPVAVQNLVKVLWTKNQELKKRLSLVEEQIKKNSKNSSRPPSTDGWEKKKSEKKSEEKRKRGGQKGHKGHERHLYETSECEEIYIHQPKVCKACGTELKGLDEKPYRHQLVEIPPLRARIVEHQLQELCCEHCGQKTRAELPETVSQSSYGERLSSLVAWLSSDYRQSHSQLQQLLERLWGIKISRASINRLRQEMSKALEKVVEEAHEKVKSQKQVHSDETGFSQGNGDGKNPLGKKGWLWVLVGEAITVFKVALSRSQESAKQMLGEDYQGIVVSDRYGSYNWLDVNQRQVCWAHLKRDFTAMSERSGVSQKIGESLLRYQQRLFRWWHQVREGKMSREQFQLAVSFLRRGLKRELETAAALPLDKKEKTPLAHTIRSCQQILKLEPALWTFVEQIGLEPTNNAAEQALRPAVIWRRTSFGSQSEAGSEFVARLLTVVISLKAQHRDVWDFLASVCRAARFDLPFPSLVPLEPQSP